MATHSSILAWRVPWTEEPGGLQFMELQRVGHDGATNTSLLPYCAGKGPCLSAMRQTAVFDTEFFGTMFSILCDETINACTVDRFRGETEMGPVPVTVWEGPEQLADTGPARFR